MIYTYMIYTMTVSQFRVLVLGSTQFEVADIALHKVLSQFT